MKTALLYTRVSHEDQVRYGISLDAQLEALKEFCKYNNYHIRKIYADEGISGASIKKRKALNEMIKEARSGDTILFTKLDRFSRNLLDANLILKELDERGVMIKAIYEEDIDTTSADGKFMFDLKLSLAERERKKTSERINDVFAYKSSKGEVTSGSVPIGYKIENKHLVIDPETKDMALYIFEYFDRCGNVQQTHKAFVKKYGNVKGVSAIKGTLKNEKYTGQFKENPHYCEKLIDIDMFDRVQSRLSKNVKHAPTGEIYLFSRLIECPRCHCIMYSYKGPTKTNVHHYYRCTNNQYAKGHKCDFTTVREDRIEEEMISKIEIFASEEKYKFEKAKSQDHEKEIKKLRQKLERLKDLYIDGDIDKASYLRKKNAFERDLINLENDTREPQKSSVNEILTLNTKDIYNALTTENKSAFWHHLVKRIHIDDDGHVVHIEFM